MTTIQSVLVAVLLVIWFCISVSFLISAIQSIVYDYKREKREVERAKHDAEYHEKCMSELK